MRIVFLGAPGSGKGTQAQKLMAEFGFPQVSTGDLLRASVADGSKLGKLAKDAMDSGELVTDEIVLGIIGERLARSDCLKGFILDGYPRNLQQAKDLQPVLENIGQKLDAALLINVDTEILTKRLTGRRTCSISGKLLNIYFSSQRELDECIDNGGQLIQRDDDNEETIVNRLKIYREQTEPLINFYQDEGLLKTVDGEGDIEDIYSSLKSALNF
ncbi:MAG: adenylate kinase [Pseudomonadota bacterium]|nr:adenylate kinase [Pseudomonadota bacterium]